MQCRAEQSSDGKNEITSGGGSLIVALPSTEKMDGLPTRGEAVAGEAVECGEGERGARFLRGPIRATDRWVIIFPATAPI